MSHQFWGEKDQPGSQEFYTYGTMRGLRLILTIYYDNETLLGQG